MKKTTLLIFFFIYGEKYFSQDWVSMPEEVNYFVYHLNVFRGNLIAGGHFSKAGNVNVRSIASWDGTTWSALGRGVANGYVVKTLVFNNELYAIGNFDSAGTVKAVDIAKWDAIDMKPTKEYFDELFRVSQNQIIWGGNYFDLPHSEGWICWDKTFKYNQKLAVKLF